MFEIVKTGNTYASTPVTLVSFNSKNGANPNGSLIFDVNGNLFGTTTFGTNNYGTVFQIVNTGDADASTLITLVNFNDSNGALPYGDLLAMPTATCSAYTATGRSTAQYSRSLRRGDRLAEVARGFEDIDTYVCDVSEEAQIERLIADELAPHDIRVNAIAPGFMPTPMHEATLAAAEERAGRMQYQCTNTILQQGGPSMEHVVRCISMLLLPAFDDLTGKTISSNFDPWEAPSFKECLPEIVRSDLYTLRRINIVNLPDGRLRETLARPWVEAKSV